MITRITTEQTYPLRNKILRPGRPVNTCFFDGDDLPTTFHYGLKKNGTLIAVLSLYETNYKNSKSLQLRGMAVDQNFQGKGFGGELLSQVLSSQQELLKNYQYIWCNARAHVTKFYQKYGLTLDGDEFEIPDVGPHFRMFKSLGPGKV